VTSSMTDGAAEAGRVVVAEGHPVVAGALSWLLREQGYSVATVADRQELFANLSQQTPDVVLLDGEVVERDEELLDELRGDQRWSDVRVIVTSPTGDSDDGAAMPWGADDCVSKPFRVPELLGRVRTQLRASNQLRVG
jgi:DNA-binding response OmpR family regulator